MISLTSPSWWIFDLYGTLVDVNWREVKERVLRATGDNRQVVELAVRQLSRRRLLGQFATAAEEWEAICREVGVALHVTSDFLDTVERNTIQNTWREIPDLVSVARQARSAGYGVALSSNCYRATSQILRQNTIGNLAHELFLSCEMGLAKPDLKYFEAILSRLGSSAHNCIYVDDRAENCLAAQELGFRAFQVVDGPARVDLQSTRGRVLDN